MDKEEALDALFDNETCEHIEQGVGCPNCCEVCCTGQSLSCVGMSIKDFF